jgi:predicted SnoaL-like aldol condensation-catalyzing enzyme
MEKPAVTDTTRSPRDIVVAFYEAALNEKDPEKAAAFLGSTYTQHNPNITDGPEALLRFVKFRRDNFAQSHSTIHQVIAEGNLVALHIHSVLVPGTPGRHIVDIFRVEGDKVVEHWDVIQEIPVQVFPPLNDNGLF